MSLFGRIVVIVIALFVSILVAGVALAIGIAAPDLRGIDSDPIERLLFFAFAFFATSFVGAVAMLPAVLAIVLAEAMRMRSFLYYGICGALIGVISYFGTDISGRLENTTDISPVGYALQLAAASGIIGGLVYWIIAGRNAGRWREYPV